MLEPGFSELSELLHPAILVSEVISVVLEEHKVISESGRVKKVQGKKEPKGILTPPRRDPNNLRPIDRRHIHL